MRRQGVGRVAQLLLEAAAKHVEVRDPWREEMERKLLSHDFVEGRRLADRLITYGKKGTLQLRRRAAGRGA